MLSRNRQQIELIAVFVDTGTYVHMQDWDRRATSLSTIFREPVWSQLERPTWAVRTQRRWGPGGSPPPRVRGHYRKLSFGAAGGGR